MANEQKLEPILGIGATKKSALENALEQLPSGAIESGRTIPKKTADGYAVAVSYQMGAGQRDTSRQHGTSSFKTDAERRAEGLYRS